MTTTPKLKENVWHIHTEEASSTLYTTNFEYSVDTSYALEFIKIRPHCNDHNTPSEISALSGVSIEAVENMLSSLGNISLLV